MVFQNPYGSLNPRKKVGAILEEPLVINTRLCQGASGRQRRGTMMAKVGLRPEHYHRYPHMFSGGQRQRIAIARALMLQPAAGGGRRAGLRPRRLDPGAGAQPADGSAGRVRARLSLHLPRPRRGAHIADEVLVMYLGRAVEQGPKDAIFRRPRHPYTRALLASTPSVERKREHIVLTGELPSPLDPPRGLRLQHPLPARDRPLPRRAAGAAPGHRTGWSPATTRRVLLRAHATRTGSSRELGRAIGFVSQNSFSPPMRAPLRAVRIEKTGMMTSFSTICTLFTYTIDVMWDDAPAVSRAPPCREGRER